MIEPPYISVLRNIYIRLKNAPSDWVITGSLGMALQDLDIEIHDIDIQTSQHGAYEIEGLLSDYVVTPVHYSASERICSYFGTLEIDGIKVEIMGDLQKLLNKQAWEDPVKVEQHRTWVNFEEMRVPVLSLEYEYQAYRKLGRIEKAEKIKSWMEADHSKNKKPNEQSILKEHPPRNS